MTPVRGWFDTDCAPGDYPLASPAAAGFAAGEATAEPAPGYRRIRVEAEISPDGKAWRVARLGDPELEAAALRLYEAESAGVEEGDLMFAGVVIGVEAVRAAAFARPEDARRFLEDEADMADGMGDHWLGHLDAAPGGGDFPPVLLVRGDGVETMDGLHRLAGHAVHGTEALAVVVGVAAGRSLSEVPGAFLDASDAPVRPGEARTPMPGF